MHGNDKQIENSTSFPKRRKLTVSKNKGKYVFESASPETIRVSSNVKVSVITNLEGFRAFFRAPWIVYRDDIYWVPPFWGEMKRFFRQNNPFWKHSEAQLFVAYKDHAAVGRIASIIDYNFSDSDGKKIGFFGFF